MSRATGSSLSYLTGAAGYLKHQLSHEKNLALLSINYILGFLILALIPT